MGKLIKNEVEEIFDKALKEKNLNPQQIEFAFQWATPVQERVMSLEFWAQTKGISIRTIYLWKLKPEIIDLRSEIFKRLMIDQEVFVLDHIRERAQNSDNPRWSEIWLEYFKNWERKNKWTNPTVAVQINIGHDEVNARLQGLGQNLKLN